EAGDKYRRGVDGVGQRCENAAQQSGNPIGADACGAALIWRIPLLPSALEPDQEADGQGETDAGDERVHCRNGAQAATDGSRSRTQLTICPADIAPEVRATSLPP